MSNSLIKYKFEMFLILAIVALLGTVVYNESRAPLPTAPQQCECPTPAPTQTSVPVITEGSALPPPEPTPLPEVVQPTAQPVTFTSTYEVDRLIGTWRGIEGKPLPEVTIEKGREGSKTPYNIKMRFDTLYIGCGFYATGTAYCQVQDKDSDAPKKVETKVFFLEGTDGSMVVTVDDLVTEITLVNDLK